MKFPRALKSAVLWAMVGAAAAVAVFLFGKGVLIRPRISISSGAIDYRIPAQYQMEIMMWKIMMSPKELQTRLTDEITASLKKYGFSEDRIKLLFAKPPAKTEWKPNEEYVIKMVLAEVQSRVLTAALQNAFDMPQGALFFEIDNTGWAAARSPHISVKIAGSTYGAPLIESENRLLNSVTTGSDLSFDYDRIAPGSKTKGVIWYSHVPNEVSRTENEISISFDQGTIRRKFSENKFFLSER